MFGRPHCCAALVLLLVWSMPARARTLTVATWDLGWFTLRPAGDPALPDHVAPKRPDDVARLARYAAALHADVIAFQGVDGAAAAAALFPAARYAIHITQDQVLQRSGFAVRRDLAFRAEPDDTALDPYAHARFPLRSGADLVLDLPGGTTLRLLSVQLKSGCRDFPLTDTGKPACATLAQQADALRDWITARTAAHQAFLILGDFARIMDGDHSFMDRLGPSGPLVRATAHDASPCWGGGNFVDHILAGGAAAGWLRPDTLGVMVFRETGPGWRDRLSSHCPVVVRLRLPD